jgi:hypothetical protein
MHPSAKIDAKSRGDHGRNDDKRNNPFPDRLLKYLALIVDRNFEKPTTSMNKTSAISS